MRHLIENMVDMQVDLNSKIAGNMSAGQAKLINWPRAAWLECAEAVNHFPWKWWKAPSPMDTDQVKLEIVDIWHFLLSWYIEYFKTKESLVEYLSVIENNFIPLTPQGAIKHLENLAAICASDSGTAPSSYSEFLYVLNAINMDISELYRLYTAKYVLNKFRAANGYNSDGYIKNWDGKEDNQHLMSIVSKMVNSKPDDIYKAFEELYNANKVSVSEPKGVKNASRKA